MYTRQNEVYHSDYGGTDYSSSNFAKWSIDNGKSEYDGRKFNNFTNQRIIKSHTQSPDYADIITKVPIVDVIE